MSIAIYPGSFDPLNSFKGVRCRSPEGAFRLSFATSRELLRKGLERFREFTQAVS